MLPSRSIINRFKTHVTNIYIHLHQTMVAEPDRYVSFQQSSNIPGPVREGQFEGKHGGIVEDNGLRTKGTLLFWISKLYCDLGHTHLLGVATEELVQKLG